MFEGILAPGYGAIALLVAFATGFWLRKLLPIASASGRNVAIDGLRGYLSLGVFLHHAVIWFFYLKTNEWKLPPVSVYTNLGTICVSLFFLITGYLFVGKIIDARGRSIDWIYLYTSRILRLTPLYLCVIIILLFTVGVLSKWTLREPLYLTIKQIANWAAFSAIQAPDVNGVKRTWILMAGVTWTLAYEWLFYLTLPALAILFRLKVPILALFGCTAIAIVIVVNKVDPLLFPISFIGGSVAAYLTRQARLASLLRNRFFSPLVIIVVSVAVFGHFSPNTTSIILALMFFPIACGNTIFGILSNETSKYLGDVSYGIYLMHGLLLFTIINFLIGSYSASALNPTWFWLLMYFVLVILISLSALTYRFIEAPAMRRVKQVVRIVRASASRYSAQRMPG